MKTDMISVRSLILFKQQRAVVLQRSNKLDIEMVDGRIFRVRPKDVLLLHPGPVSSLDTLEELKTGEIEVAWEILAGTRTTLEELAELIYGVFTPSTAWVTWQLILKDGRFAGTPDSVEVYSAEQIAEREAARRTEASKEESWNDYINRIRLRQSTAEDCGYLREVELLALGRTTRNRTLRTLGRSENPENAHSLLLDLGYWDYSANPYPQRFGLGTSQPDLPLPDPPDEPRMDLTHLASFAIDDEGVEAPDDAISLEGNRLWIHVADVSASVPPDSEIDQEASGRGATLHLPENVVHMLPGSAISHFGLGMTEISPALSFGIELDDDGRIVGSEIVASLVRVTRTTYSEIETRINEAPFDTLLRWTERYRARREEDGAVFIELPEIRVIVREGEVTLHPVRPLASRGMVREAMIMAGEATAQFASRRGIPLPFAVQEPYEIRESPKSISEMYACRRSLKARQYKTIPSRHFGLGLESYTQATSPLRRYLDLVVHQQLRSYLRGEKLLSSQEILTRAGAAETTMGSVRRVDQLSRRHWTIVYLLRYGEWTGEGLIVEKRGLRGRVLVPQLGLETQVQLQGDYDLDSSIPLILSGASLPRLETHFRIQ